MWPSQLNRNLGNCEVARKKGFWDFNGIGTRGLCVRAAVLYQLSYEGPYTGSRPIYWVHQPDSTATVTYSFHLYSCSSHHFVLCFTPFTHRCHWLFIDAIGYPSIIRWCHWCHRLVTPGGTDSVLTSPGWIWRHRISWEKPRYSPTGCDGHAEKKWQQFDFHNLRWWVGNFKYPASRGFLFALCVEWKTYLHPQVL